MTTLKKCHYMRKVFAGYCHHVCSGLFRKIASQLTAENTSTVLQTDCFKKSVWKRFFNTQKSEKNMIKNIRKTEQSKGFSPCLGGH